MQDVSDHDAELVQKRTGLMIWLFLLFLLLGDVGQYHAGEYQCISDDAKDLGGKTDRGQEPENDQDQCYGADNGLSDLTFIHKRTGLKSTKYQRKGSLQR